MGYYTRQMTSLNSTSHEISSEMDIIYAIGAIIIFMVILVLAINFISCAYNKTRKK